MGKKLLKYYKPKIAVKKVKISFFLSNIFWLDQFNMVGDVYAQSGGAPPGIDIALDTQADRNGDGVPDFPDDPGAV